MNNIGKKGQQRQYYKQTTEEHIRKSTFFYLRLIKERTGHANISDGLEICHEPARIHRSVPGWDWVASEVCLKDVTNIYKDFHTCTTSNEVVSIYVYIYMY